MPDTVLAYKRAHHIGRFDPNVDEIQNAKIQRTWEDMERKSEAAFLFDETFH